MSDHRTPARFVTTPWRAASRIGLRWILAPSVLLLEYISISLRFDAYALAGRGLFGAEHLGKAATVVVATVLATAILRGKSLVDDIAQSRATTVNARTWLFVALHLVAFLGLWAATAQVFDSRTTTSPSIGALAVWLVLALATPATLLALLIKRGSRWLLVRRLAPSMVVGFLAGGSAVLMGYMSSLLWRTTGETTLWTSRWALSQFVDDIVYDPHALVLGTSSFSVQIAPICSGFEGMGLIAAILGGYIFIHRKTLRFPIVLAVIPVAVVTVWLFNIARIAALILIGTYGWQEVAVGGFHSRAGWIAFCVVAIAFIALLQRSRLFSVQALDAPLQQTEEASNVTPYVLPLMVLIAASLLTGLFAEAVDMLYPVRVVVAVVCLLALRTSYKGLIVRLNMSNVVVGLAVYGLWVATVPPASDSGDFLYGSLLEMKAPARVVWIVMRVFGSTLIVPIVEELAFRGYLLRRLTARNFEAVSYDNVAWLPLVGSSLVFGSLHGHLLAGTIAGLLFGLVQARGGRIGDAIAAHAIANGLIAMQVLFLSHWGWWG